MWNCFQVNKELAMGTGFYIIKSLPCCLQEPSVGSTCKVLSYFVQYIILLLNFILKLYIITKVNIFLAQKDLHYKNIYVNGCINNDSMKKPFSISCRLHIELTKIRYHCIHPILIFHIKRADWDNNVSHLYPKFTVLINGVFLLKIQYGYPGRLNK